MYFKAGAAALLAIAFSAGIASAAMSSAMTSSVTVKMKAQNNSGENGTATLTQMPKGVKVVINLTGAPASAQPAHIHMGTCANLNPAPQYPLHNVVNGMSTTMLPGLKLSGLAGGKYAINVHKSLNAIKVYVSCGNIK